jgi:hypothetical protein
MVETYATKSKGLIDNAKGLVDGAKKSVKAE